MGERGTRSISQLCGEIFCRCFRDSEKVVSKDNFSNIYQGGEQSFPAKGGAEENSENTSRLPPPHHSHSVVNIGKFMAEEDELTAPAMHRGRSGRLLSNSTPQFIDVSSAISTKFVYQPDRHLAVDEEMACKECGRRVNAFSAVSKDICTDCFMKNNVKFS